MKTGKASNPLENSGPYAGLACLGAVCILLGFVFRSGELPRLALCPFREWSGLPCPGCGITRAFCAIGHGDFTGAWKSNPFAFVLYAACVGLVALPLLSRVTPGLVRRVSLSPWLERSAIAFVCLMWVFGMVRIWQCLR